VIITSGKPTEECKNIASKSLRRRKIFAESQSSPLPKLLTTKGKRTGEKLSRNCPNPAIKGNMTSNR
jgi:hypothetical protein